MIDIVAQPGVRTSKVHDVCWSENVTHREKTALFVITLSMLTKNPQRFLPLHCLYDKVWMSIFFLFSRFTLAGIFCSVQQMNKLAEIKMKSLDVSFIIQQISESLFYIVSITCWRCSKEREAAGINGDFNVCFSQLYYGVKIE